MSRLIGLALADIHVNDWKENYGYKGDRLQKSLVPLQIVGVGCEIDEEYFNKQNKRYEEFVSQARLF